MSRLSGLPGTIVALLATATFLGLGLISFYNGTAATKPVVMPFDLFWCAKDEDCISVDRIGCCSCEQGGAQAAITRWHADELRLFLKRACRKRPVCVQFDLCQNDTKAICEDHACRLVPDPDRARRSAEPAPGDGAPEAPKP